MKAYLISSAAITAAAVGACSIINGEELKRFDCTLQTISPNPNKYDLKGKAIDYYLYRKEKNEIIHISHKWLGAEEVKNKLNKAYEKDGKILWTRDKEGESYNNYLTIKTLKLKRIIYDGKGNGIADFACKKVK